MAHSVLSRNHVIAASSGACAAMTSLLFKLASSDEMWSSDGYLVYVVRAVLVASAILLNGVMWTLFVESKLSTSETMLYSVSSNIIITSLVGFLFFREPLHVTWFLGASLIVYGLRVMMMSSSPSTSSSSSPVKSE